MRAHAAHPAAALFRSHFQRPPDTGGDPIDIIRVHDHGIAELGGGAGELAEHEHAIVVHPRRHELLGDEIHAVAQRCHQHHIGRTVQGDEITLRNRPVHVLDRR